MKSSKIYSASKVLLGIALVMYAQNWYAMQEHWPDWDITVCCVYSFAEKTDSGEVDWDKLGFSLWHGDPWLTRTQLKKLVTDWQTRYPGKLPLQQGTYDHH